MFKKQKFTKENFLKNFILLKQVNFSFFDLKKVLKNFNGEFDPGSGRTLAVCLTHASRTRFFLKLFSFWKRDEERIAVADG